MKQGNLRFARRQIAPYRFLNLRYFFLYIFSYMPICIWRFASLRLSRGAFWKWEIFLTIFVWSQLENMLNHKKYFDLNFLLRWLNVFLCFLGASIYIVIGGNQYVDANTIFLFCILWDVARVLVFSMHYKFGAQMFLLKKQNRIIVF